jgi:hypothetical protein
MRGKYSAVLAVVVGLMLVSAAALMAQAKADYDTSKQLKLDATITRFELTDMHAQILFDAADDKGSVQHWTVEADNVNTDYRFEYGNDQGWNRLTFQAGDKVSITFNPSKQGAKGTGLLLRADWEGQNAVFRVKKDQK